MKRRDFIKFGSQATVAGTLLVQLSACSSDSDDFNNSNNDSNKIDDLGY